MNRGGNSDASIERERRAKDRAAFLAESSRLLADSLDYETTLATVAGLALPHLGAWCFVDLVGPGPGEEMRRLAVIHPEEDRQAMARQLERGWPPQRDDPFGIPRAVRTRRSEIISEVTDEMLKQAAHGEENLRLLHGLGIASLIVTPLIARGEVLGAITYVAPETHRPYTEEDLALAEDLATRCAIAIDNARLFKEARAAQARAEEANRAKTLFLGTMSHELRTPLNAIAGYAQLLEMGVHGPLTEKQQAEVERIRINQKHLLGLVNSVLDFARIEAGRMEYRMEEVSMADVLAQVDTLVHALSEERGVTVVSECPEQDLAVEADPEKLLQILTNLVGNAIKFSPRDSQVEVHCTGEDGRMETRVTDRGVGIAARDLDKIFTPFVQVQEGFTRSEEGTGLGLAISRNLARGMGGDLTVTSEVGEGSTFTLILPRTATVAPGESRAGKDA